MKKLNMMKNLILYNWRPLVEFELYLQNGIPSDFTPLLWRLFDVILTYSGYSYLTLENIIPFFTKPFTMFSLLLLLFLATFYAMIDIGAVVFALDQSFQKKKVHFRQILIFSAKNALRAWNPANILLIVVVLLLIPFLNIGMASSFIATISIPEFIMDYINATPLLASLFAAVVLLLSFLMMRWIYIFHYFTLESCSFREARKRSSDLSRKRRLRDFLSMIGAQAAFAFLSIAFVLLIVALTSAVSRSFSGNFFIRWIASTAIWALLLFSLAVIAALSVPVGYGYISALFYTRKEENWEKVLHPAVPEYTADEVRIRKIHRFHVILGSFIAICSLTIGYLFHSGMLNPNIEYVRTMEVTAHRGASAFYPENTMAAFKGAKKLGADWIELDVQQTKDGKIIVIHDTNLKRTTGTDANTWEMSYEEIEKLDAGSFFDPKCAGEKIPLLSEAAEFARENNIRLNIELKPTGHETDFEKNVADIINQTQIRDICVITSQAYDVLERVKAYDPNITTVYVMSIAYGDINQFTAADHFSVEATNATPALISRVHNAGKQLYVWTVNTRENITKMAERNVDNIITDDVALAKQCIYESRYSDWFMEYLKWFE